MVLALAVLVIALQVLTGVVWWAWLRRGTTMSWTEALGMGTALGTLLSLASAQLLRTTPLASWAWLIPTVLALGVLGLSLAHRVRLASITEPLRAAWWAWGPAAVLGLLILVPSILRAPIDDGYLTGDAYHGDLVFQESVSRTVTLFGSGDNILLAGEPLKYHWFAYGWAGMVTEAIGSGPFVVLTRVMPVLLVLGCAWLAAAWASSLSTNRWAPGLASLLVVLGAYLGARQGVMLPFESPSNGYATIILLAFALVMTRYLRSQIGEGALLVFLALAIGIVGAKASQATVLAVGLAVVLIGTLVRGRVDRGRVDRGRVVRMVVVTAVGMLASSLAVLAGIAGSQTQIQLGGTAQHASTFQGLDGRSGGLGLMIGIIAIVLAAAPRWAGLVFLVRDRSTRWQPETLLGLGLVLAAIGTLAVLRSGTNAAWFALAATAPLAVLSSVGVAGAWDRIRESGGGAAGEWTGRRLRVLLAGIVLGALAVCLVVFVNTGFAEVSGAPIRWRGPVLAWLVAAGAAGLLLLAIRRRSWALWGVVLVLVMSVAAIGARFIGPLLWEATGSRLSPWFAAVILRLDPQAELPSAAGSVTLRGGPGVSAAVRVPPSRDLQPGVAYSMGIVEWTPALNEASRALVAAAAPADIVATDITNLQPFLPVMTGLRTLLNGQPYVDGYTTASGVAAIAERRALLDAFLAAPSAGTRDALRAAGVRWLWLQRDAQAQAERMAGLGTVLTTNAEVTVVDISGAGASSP